MKVSDLEGYRKIEGFEETRFAAWLEEMFPRPDLRVRVQEVLGYLLCPDLNFGVWVYFLGEGHGKSTLVEFIRGLLGPEQCVHVDLGQLDRGAVLQQMEGKLCYFAGEVCRGSFKHLALLKQITSGERVMIEPRYRHAYAAVLGGRFVMETQDSGGQGSEGPVR